MGRINQKLKEKILESLSSVLPITAIVLALSLTVIPVPIGTLLLFLAGAVLLILGMGLFSLGAEMAMMPMGEALGARLTRTRRIGLVVVVFFAMGVIVTIAEPDLAVLARQVPAIPDSVLIFTVAAGVGFFLVLAMLRTLFKVKLGHLLIFFYALVFGVALFAPKSFLAVAFDSGGVTTGPITVPFIMALGIGMASTRGDSTSQEDSFGMVALSSVGPILTVLILGICYNPSSAEYVAVTAPEVHTSVELGRSFAQGAPHHAKEVLSAIFPMGVVLALLQLCTRAFGKRQLIKVLVGLGYTLLGLIMFLTGVNIGFMPAGHFLGSALALSPAPWSLILLGMVMGWYIVAAEPAVHVLNRQVEEITSGAVSQQAMQRSLSLGVAVSIGLSMARILWGIPLFWFVLPGYALALGLSLVVPPIFTGIAFDSGGVASGPMTATFLLPFAMGACEALGGDILSDAFGIVALVAMTPLVTIQLLGLWSQMRAKTGAIFPAPKPELDDIIEYEPVVITG
ncbi:MAG: DUF1538 domain-containing protein [Angelakisella sp.]|nr:DUF1538 domain-containing protein [Angelakisella sp.]